MLVYLFKISWRGIQQSKFILAVNYIGFTVGLTVCTILFLWTRNQYACNSYLPESYGVCEVMTTYSTGSSPATVGATSLPIIEKLENQLPEIQELGYLSLIHLPKSILSGKKTFIEKGITGTPSLLSIFDRKIIYSPSESSLNDPISILISESLAKKMFAENWRDSVANPNIYLDGWKPVEIKAVYHDFPEASTTRFDFLIPIDPDRVDNIGNFSFKTFVKLGHSDRDVVEKKANALLTGLTQATVLLQPFEKSYLYNVFRDGKEIGGRIDYVYLFIVAGFFVMSMVLLNFTNLFVASYIRRFPALRLRQIVGEEVRHQRIQVLIEISLLTLISMCSALILSYLFIPLCNEILETDLLNSAQTNLFWLGVVLIWLLTAAIAGFYPAFVLTSSKTLSTALGRSQAVQNIRMNKSAFIIQFFFTNVILVFSFGVTEQLQFLLKKDLGYSTSNVLCYELSPTAKMKIDVIQNQINNKSFFTEQTLCSVDLLKGAPMIGDIEWPGKDPDDSTKFGVIFTDEQFLNALQIQPLMGDLPQTKFGKLIPVVVNLSAARKLGGVEKILNRQVKVWGGDGIVTGVVSDFHFNTLFSQIEPLIVANLPSEAEFLFIRVRKGSEQEALETLSKIHSTITELPFSFFWMDERIRSIYKNERAVSVISQSFSILAIVISLIGLSAISFFDAQKRMKEFAIRKVHGGGVLNMFSLLAKDYIVLSIISSVVAIPVASYFVSRQMSSYAFSTEVINLKLLLLLVLISAVMICTVLFHGIKVSRTSPIKFLRLDM